LNFVQKYKSQKIANLTQLSKSSNDFIICMLCDLYSYLEDISYYVPLAILFGSKGIIKAMLINQDDMLILRLQGYPTGHLSLTAGGNIIIVNLVFKESKSLALDCFVFFHRTYMPLKNTTDRLGGRNIAFGYSV
jgi:hypothetical protein